MNQKSLIGSGIFSAFAASLCCITPLLAFVAGTSGVASTFSWIEPIRPYLIGFTVLILGFAWWKKLKPVKVQEDACGCEVKTSFWQSKFFLGIITVFAAMMLSLPYYSHLFYPQQQTLILPVGKNNLQTSQFEISGMTCQGCEEHVKVEVNKLEGIAETQVSYTDANAIVKYDASKVSIDQIKEAINSTGYKVTSN